MRATVTRSDGTVIKLKGSPEEVIQVLNSISPYWSFNYGTSPITFTPTIDPWTVIRDSTITGGTIT